MTGMCQGKNLAASTTLVACSRPKAGSGKARSGIPKHRMGGKSLDLGRFFDHKVETEAWRKEVAADPPLSLDQATQCAFL